MNSDRMRARGALGVAGALIVIGSAAASRGRAEDPAGTAPVPLPAGAVVLFDGKDTSRWVKRGTEQPAPWVVTSPPMKMSGNVATAVRTAVQCRGGWYFELFTSKAKSRAKPESRNQKSEPMTKTQ